MKTTKTSQKERYILTVLGRIFREVFDNDSMEITFETSTDLIDDWDSVNHVKLVLSIEEEFDIRFDMEAVYEKKLAELERLKEAAKSGIGKYEKARELAIERKKKLKQ